MAVGDQTTHETRSSARGETDLARRFDLEGVEAGTTSRTHVAVPSLYDVEMGLVLAKLMIGVEVVPRRNLVEYWELVRA